MDRPPELAYKYGNLSEGVCKPGYAAAKMTTIYPKWEGVLDFFFFLQHIFSQQHGDALDVALDYFESLQQLHIYKQEF